MRERWRLLVALVASFHALAAGCGGADPVVQWRPPPPDVQGRSHSGGAANGRSVLSVGDSYDDFPSIVEDRQGTLYVAYAAYLDGRDEIRLHRRMADGRWSLPIAVPTIAPKADVWMPQLAVDGANRLWVVWSEQLGGGPDRAGNWDLYARVLSQGRWGSPVRLSADPRPDINHRVTTDAEGNIYLVWQAHPESNGDIHFRRFADGRWSEPVPVTSGPASDWFPDVAVDEAGTAWIAFDSYRLGDYDVYLSSVRGDDAGPLISIATSPFFEAHASVAARAGGEVWVAWEQRGPHWGKEVGFALPPQTQRGTMLGGGRANTIHVLQLADGRSLAAPSLAASLPRSESAFLGLPDLMVDAQRQLWLRFRRRHDSERATPLGPRGASYWTENLARLGADGWDELIELPESAGRLAAFNSSIATRAGAIVAAYSADGRGASDYHVPDRERVSVVERPVPAPSAPMHALGRYRPPGPTAERSHAAEARDVERMRAFRASAKGAEYRILRGDLHRHTEFSRDSGPRFDGSLIDAYRYLIDVAGLDFGAITDHQGGIHPYWRWLTEKAADLYHLPPRFVALFGYERSVNFPHGHRNVFHDHRGVAVFPFKLRKPRALRERPPSIVSGEHVLENDTLLLYDSLRTTGGIAIPHSTATYMGTDWRVHDPELEPVVEIYQGSRTSFEMQGGPRTYDGQGQPAPHGGFRPEGFVSNALARGYYLGFIASSDHNSTHVSYAMVYARANDRRSILRGLRRRSTYAATDNILLDFRADGHLLGERYATDRPPTLDLYARGTDQIATVDLIHNGHVIHTEAPEGKLEVEVRYRHDTPAPGLNHYYFRLVQTDGEVAWASPIWVDYAGGAVP